MSAFHAGWKPLPILAWLLSALLCGCAGPKIMSAPLGGNFDRHWDTAPTDTGISVRLLHSALPAASPNIEPSKVFVGLLANKLKDATSFPNVSTDEAAGGRAQQARLALEVAVMKFDVAGWAGRALVGSYSMVGVVGRLVDTKEDNILFTFNRSRMSQGGLLGAGGLLSAGKDSMGKTLLSWVADDVVKALNSWTGKSKGPGSGHSSKPNRRGKSQ